MPGTFIPATKRAIAAHDRLTHPPQPAHDIATPKRRADATERAIEVVFAANLVVIGVFWWVSSGSQPIHNPADVLNDIGRITALIGTFLVLCQLILMSRIPWLEQSLGMERMARLHRWNAYPALGLIVAHAVFQTLGYQVANNQSTFGMLALFVTTFDGLLGAIVGLVLLLVVVGLSLSIARERLSYQAWYFVHLYTYIAIALAFGHQLATGLDFINNRAFAAYWYALYALVVAALLVFRVGAPIRSYLRHGFRVVQVDRVAPATVSIWIGGRDLADFHYHAGQFLIWRFLDRQRWWEAHPFTISTPPGGDYLRLTVRGVGDFSSKLAGVAPGTPVLVEGPFGHFTPNSSEHPKVLLVAGGIGITPLRALADEMAEEGRDVVLVYRARHQRAVAFRDELDEMERDLGVRVEYTYSDADRKRNWLNPAWFRQHVPDIRERDVFICGPPAMTARVETALAAVGVGPHQVRKEAFRF